MIAVCPGSFDPVTVGHVDIVTRAAAMFDKVYVAVMVNVAKQPSFTEEERVDMLRRTVGRMENVEVVSFHGLLADFARQIGAGVIVKGLRAVSDYEYEFQMALANRKLAPEIETVFLTTSAENMFLSSSIVKQLASFNGDISALVPEEVCEDVKARLIRGDSIDAPKK